MKVASGDYGDAAILHSPMQKFSYPTKVSFLLDMNSDPDDVTTKFHVYVTWQGMTFDPILTFNQPVYSTKQQLCMPPGEYSLKFVFIGGYTINPFIGMDDVEVEPVMDFNSSAYGRADFISSKDAFQYLRSVILCDIGMNSLLYNI